MALKSSVYKQSIKKVGYWNFKELYNFCFSWLKDNGYGLKETEYTEKSNDFGKEILITWEASRKVTDYFKNTITMKWHILGMNSAQIERSGKTEKTNNGEVKIDFSADLVKDYEERWENKLATKFFRGIYDNYIMRTTTEQYEDRLKDDIKELISQTKAFLEL